MMTATEARKLQEQINTAFQGNWERLDALEQKVKELEAALKTKKAPAPKAKAA